MAGISVTDLAGNTGVATDWWARDPVTEDPAPAQAFAAPTPQAQPMALSPFAGAISNIESGGRYDLLGPATRSGDRAHGKYQVMGENIGPWTEAALGRRLTPEQFLASPDAQEAVFAHQFGQYVKKYGPEGAARAWFAGEGGMNHPERRDALGTSVADYSRRFMNGLGPSMAYADEAPQAPVHPAMTFGQDRPQPAPVPPQPSYGAMPQPLYAGAAPAPMPRPAPMPQMAQNVPQGAPVMPWVNDPQVSAGAMPWEKDPPVQPPAAPQRGLVDYIPAAISDIPGEAYTATADALKNARNNLVPGYRDFANEGPIEGLMNTGSGVVSALSAPFAPGVGALRSLFGHPLADLEHLAGSYIAPDIAAKDDPEQMYQEAKRGVDTALMAAAPRGVSPLAPRGPAGAPAPAVPTRQQIIAEAADRQGVPMPRAATTDSVPMQASAGALKEIPVVGTPLVNASRNALTQLDRAVGDTVAGYGSGKPLSAGEAAIEGIEGWVGGKSKQVAERLYGNVDALINPGYTRPIYATQRTIADIMAKRANAKISGASPAVSEVVEASQAPGGLNYAGLKDLRSHIGDMTPEEMVAKGINKAEAKRIYNAMTQDLRGTVLDSGGPDALRAFDRANSVYETIVEKRKALAKIIGVKADAAPERALARISEMASSKGGANYTGLVQLRRAIGPQKWDEIASSIINRMGRDKPDAAFSGDRFKTSWDAMPENTRRLVFNSTNKPGLAKSVEDIMILSDAHKQLMKYGNPSGSGRVATFGGMGALLWAEPLTAIGSAVGGNILARIMASPVAAKQTATWANAYVNAVQNASPGRLSAVTTASANLANTLNKQFGTAITGPDLLRLQGPVPGRADDEKPKP